MLIIVSNVVTTKEELLSNEDFALYEYSKHLSCVNYPVFVLNYMGEKGSEIPKHEVTWGLGDVETEIRARKVRLIREKTTGTNAVLARVAI